MAVLMRCSKSSIYFCTACAALLALACIRLYPVLNSYIRWETDNIGSRKGDSVDKYVELMSKTSLSRDARFIVRSVLEAHFQPLPSASNRPRCKGDTLPGEVEDILCIPRPKFIKGVKNPCWWQYKGQERTVKCLPYFHILGFGKSGTTDLWHRLHQHRALRSSNRVKEKIWWGWRRYGNMNYYKMSIQRFSDYLSRFRILSHLVEKSLAEGSVLHKTVIAGDGSPSDISDFRGWPNISQNRGLKLPVVLTPHLMEHFYPDPKFIVLIRNPVDRMYSEYLYINHTWPKSPELFHQRVVKSIDILASCIRDRGVKECFFDSHIHSALPLRLHFFFYSVFVIEWLKVFPRDKFLFLSTEEYGQDIETSLRSCFRFLKIGIPSKGDLRRLAQQRRRLVKTGEASEKAMLTNTRRLLEAMARPVMRLLADMLDDQRFRFDGK